MDVRMCGILVPLGATSNCNVSIPKLVWVWVLTRASSGQPGLILCPVGLNVTIIDLL